MRLGLHLGYWGFGIEPGDQETLVLDAEQLGFDSAWTAEAMGSDAVTVLTWLAAHTSTIRLGTAVMQMPARSPAMTAMTAATLDRLSHGRFVLGLGSSGPQVAEGLHGAAFGGMLARTRDYVEIVRRGLRGRRLRYAGGQISIPPVGSSAKPLRLDVRPVQERLPIYLAAMGPRNTALAGELADGWLPMVFSPEDAEASRDALAAGAARANRSLEADGFDVAPSAGLAVDDDVERARDRVRPLLAHYLGGMGTRTHNFYNAAVRRLGHAAVAEEVQERYLRGDRRGAARALPGEVVDRLALCGPPRLLVRRLEAYADASVGTLIVTPIADDLAGRRAALATIAGLL